MSRGLSGREADLPRYEFPRLPLFTEFALDLLLGRQRSFLRDSQRVLRANPYPRQVLGLENVPPQGPFALIVNHYNRTGLRPYHCAMVITAAIAQKRPGQEIRWIIIGEWHGRRLGPIPVPSALFRWAFHRIGALYGLIVMPQRAALAMGRAVALRRAVHLAMKEPIGLMPEAGGPGILREPLPGSGLFLAALAQRGLPLLPVGVWEEDNTLFVRFGEPFALALPKQASRQEQDRLAREQMMVAVGCLLPQAYWGFYRQAIEKAVSGA